MNRHLAASSHEASDRFKSSHDELSTRVCPPFLLLMDQQPRWNVMAKHKIGVLLLIGAGLISVAVWRIELASAQVLATRYVVPIIHITAAPSADAVKNGYRLAHLNDCFGCHGDRLTGRVVFTGWFGTRIAAPNLTRLVRREGDAQLAAAIRYGIKPDGTSLVEMPSDQFIKMSDSDLEAILSYLRSLPARTDTVGVTRWRLDGRILLATGILPTAARLVDRSKRGPVQTPSRPLALGRYITGTQCAVCHGSDLSGDTVNDSPDLHIAIRDYSLSSFEHFFRTGQNPIRHNTPVMTNMIRGQFRYLPPLETRAIYAFLNAKGA